MRTHRFCVLLLLVVSTAACRRDIPPLSLKPTASPPLRLEFLPPADSVLTETVKSSVRRDGAPGAQEADMTTVARFTADQGGWLLTQRVTQARYSRDGAPVQTLVDDVLTRFPLRVRLAADGTYVQVVDPEAARVALQAVAPEGQELLALERFFSPESLEARTRDEWEMRYGNLYGQGLSPGRSTYVVGSVPLGGQEVTFVLERTFTGTLLTEYGEVVVLTLRCLDAPVDKMTAEVRQMLWREEYPPLTAGVQCEGEQLLGKGRFLPVRRGLTLRATVGGETWTWTTQSALESLQAPEEER